MTAPDPLADVLADTYRCSSGEDAEYLARAAREHIAAEATECSECGNACTCGRDEPEIDCPIHGLTREQLWERLDRLGREKTAADNEVERLRWEVYRVRDACAYAEEYETPEGFAERVLVALDGEYPITVPVGSSIALPVEDALAAIVALPRNMAGGDHYLAVELALAQAEQIVAIAARIARGGTL